MKNYIKLKTDVEKQCPVVIQFDAYCKRTLANAVKTYYSRQKKRCENEISLESIPPNIEPFTEDEYFKSPDGINIANEDLRQALDRLADTDRDIVLRYYVLEQKDPQISDALKCSRSYVNYRRQKAVDAIRRLL